MQSSFKARMQAGEKLFGTMISLPCAATAEIIAEAGFDWLFLDGEHGPLQISDIGDILRAVDDKVACIVRVPEAAEVPIKKVLDLGATGIIVPQVNTAQQAADVVRWAKYAPVGARGVGLARAHGYGMRFGEYIATANDQTVVMVQAEHAMAVENILAIVRVPGIDALQLGPYDLSASMGKMGQINDPEVVAAIDRIINAGLAAGLAIGCFGLTADSIKTYVDRGSNLICAGVDTMLLGKAASELVRELQADRY